MKILAIRGSNLTSFAGDFVLELDEPPLDRLGLFAITGATGAGKSTLLDAMCLALFDRVPRMEEHRGVLVGREEEEDKFRIRSDDVRGLLRRGAGEGYAEVDFVGRDGRRYRARWSVRRANRKPEGRFQDQEMSLTDLATGQTFGSKRTEVRAAIIEKLGLSFDQFRRSALLAQGEFAAFLRANDEQRADLLERMTGTEVYSRLSVAAHQRLKEVQEELSKLEQGVAAILRLPEEERAALEEERAREEAALAEAQAAQERAEQAARWYAERARLAEEEAKAEQARAQAAEALEAAAPREAELARVRTAEELRAPVSRADEARRVLEAEESTLATRRTEAERARAVALEREEEQAGAEARRTAAQQEEANARPALVEAVRLDAELDRARHDAAEATRKREEVREAERLAREAVEKVAREESSARAEVELETGWLGEHGHLEALAREWPRWDAELTRYGRAAQEEASARESLVRLQARAESLGAEAERRREEQRKAGEAVEEAEAALAKAEATQSENASAERRVRRVSLLSRQEVLKSLVDARSEASEATHDERKAAEEAASARAEEASSKAEAEAAKVLLVEKEAALKEAQRALESARSVQGLSSHRAELREGEPCPLCGAKEHPYGRDEAALEGLVVKAQERVRTLDAERTKANRAEVSASERAESAGIRATQAESRREEAAKRRASFLAEWAAGREKLEGERPPEEAESPTAGAWLEAELAEAKKQLSVLSAEEEEAEKQARVAKEARAELARAREKREDTEKALRQAEEFLRENAEKRGGAERDMARSAADRQEVLAALATPFTGWPDWEASLAAEPADFRARCEQQKNAWETHEQDLRKAEARVAQAREKRAPTEARAEMLRTQLEGHEQELARVEEALKQTRDARAAVLGGRPTAEVRAALEKALKETSQLFESARTKADQARQGAAVASERVEAAVQAEQVARKALAEAEEALASLLAARELSLEAARTLLARGAAWCEAEERALAELRKAHESALTVLRERQAQRLRHESSGVPAIAESEAAAQCERARDDTEVRRQSVANLKARLAQDDEARQRHGEQARLLEEKQRASGVWRTLGELIGSHDGKKFKVFAQSLTLDALLHYANAHLEELAPRYRLMRVPRYDLDLQIIDRDMGDEVRGVTSLSGGESFLVSLALALGLASLSSETTQVETLFIDEGFGTLDPETLEVALATLDALQATGRQVGIISHVSGLAERIGVQVRVVKQGAGRSRRMITGDLGFIEDPGRDGGKTVSVA
ncbi:MAG TPA: AAA family ATPase [Myxococcaceae bacterium]|nr:AAA family ATPase [Myxococcaceae bacterium]